ncbi:protein of unknown function (DUF4272) [Micromonospora mirobrigensis]|uniref:DUF4272 domain-containing protein n=1 Tax=Micromonospora mirobrigensis TaxID=262898 RepID=A0A1C4UUV5_9ACTN|nr:protein of unknown function (DUF4272) [Micromonospora mirobrigensis]
MSHVSRQGPSAVLVPAPDPRAVREASLEELTQLGLPLPPSQFPLVWEPGDEIELRPLREIEARIAVLHLILARCFGMPPQAAMSWLLNSHLVEMVTPPEWEFVMGGKGDHRSFVLHHDALFSLCWVLGLTKQLDPTVPVDEHLVELMPNIAAGESFAHWRSRILAVPQHPADAAALLDLHYCLDWAYLELEEAGRPVPGLVDANAIGQRRWALEWAVMLRGPYHEEPPGWEEVDLST